MKEKFIKIFILILMYLNLQSIAAQNTTFNGNYYIKPEGIYVNSDGLHALIDGVVIPISVLCSDESGLYIPYAEIAGKLEYCPFCQSWYDPEYGHDCSGPRE